MAILEWFSMYEVVSEHAIKYFVVRGRRGEYA
jgi:hypothetical protein